MSDFFNRLGTLEDLLRKKLSVIIRMINLSKNVSDNTIVFKEGTEKKGGINRRPTTPKPDFHPQPQKVAKRD